MIVDCGVKKILGFKIDQNPAYLYIWIPSRDQSRAVTGFRLHDKIELLDENGAPSELHEAKIGGLCDFISLSRLNRLSHDELRELVRYPKLILDPSKMAQSILRARDEGVISKESTKEGLSRKKKRGYSPVDDDKWLIMEEETD